MVHDSDGPRDGRSPAFCPSSRMSGHKTGFARIEARDILANVLRRRTKNGKKDQEQ